MGGNATSNFYEAAITIMPDLLFASVVCVGLVIFFTWGKFTFILFDKLVLFYILFNLLYGTLLSKNLFIAAQGFRITYLPVIFYFIGRLFSRGKPEIYYKSTRHVFTWFVFYAIAALLFHFLFPGIEASLITASNHGPYVYFIPRMVGFFLTPVLFGTVMAMACLYFYFRLAGDNTMWNYLSLIILWACIFLSISRGPILAALLGFALITILFRQWIKGLILLVIILLVSSLLSYLLVGSFQPLAWLFSSTADTLSLENGVSRVELWRRSAHDFFQRPYGYGLGHAGATAIRFLKGTSVPAAVYTSDGWFLKLACETGIPGFLSYFALCFYYLYYAWQNISKQMDTLFPFIVALFIMINAQCIVANVFDFYPVISLIWLLMGYSINLCEQKNIPLAEKA